MPPVYPNGWFIVLETDNLPKKATKEVSVLGTYESISKVLPRSRILRISKVKDFQDQ